MKKLLTFMVLIGLSSALWAQAASVEAPTSKLKLSPFINSVFHVSPGLKWNGAELGLRAEFGEGRLRPALGAALILNGYYLLGLAAEAGAAADLFTVGPALIGASALARAEITASGFFAPGASVLVSADFALSPRSALSVQSGVSLRWFLQFEPIKNFVTIWELPVGIKYSWK